MECCDIPIVINVLSQNLLFFRIWKCEKPFHLFQGVLFPCICFVNRVSNFQVICESSYIFCKNIVLASLFHFLTQLFYNCTHQEDQRKPSAIWTPPRHPKESFFYLALLCPFFLVNQEWEKEKAQHFHKHLVCFFLTKDKYTNFLGYPYGNKVNYFSSVSVKSSILKMISRNMRRSGTFKNIVNRKRICSLGFGWKSRNSQAQQ